MSDNDLAPLAASVAALNARLEAEHSARELVTHLAMDLAKPCADDCSLLMPEVLRYLGRQLGFERVFMLEIHATHAEKVFEWVDSTLPPCEPDVRQLMPIDSPVFGNHCRPGKTILMDRVSSWDHIPPPYVDWFHATGAASALLAFHGSVESFRGAVVFEKHGDSYPWTANNRELIQTAVDLLGIAHRRFHADAVLRESEQFLKMAQAAAGLICWEIRVDKYIKMFGHCFDTVETSDHIRKLPWDRAFEIYAPPYDDRVRAVVLDAWKTGQPFVIEAMLSDNGGGERWVEVRAQVKMGEGENASIHGTTQDIDSRKRMERKLRDANAKLDDLARRDALTGLLNKREFAKDIQNLSAVFERIKRPLSMIMLDIDHFKLYNDHYGHLAGDDCLRQVGQVIADCLLRDADSAYRYGGEEFAVILPDTNQEGAARVAEKIRSRIQIMGLPHEKSLTAAVITSSVGFATADQSEPCKPNDLIARADAALYRAKRTGRNRVAGAE